MRRVRAVGRPERGDTGVDVARRARSVGSGAGEHPETAYGVRQVRQPHDLLLVDRDIQARNLGALRGITAGGPRDHHVRVQPDQALEVNRGHIADARNTARRRWLVGIFDGGNYLGAGTGGEQHLGCTGRQAHDATRRGTHAQRAARVIGHAAAGRRVDGGRCGLRYAESQEEDAEACS